MINRKISNKRISKEEPIDLHSHDSDGGFFLEWGQRSWGRD